MPSPSCRYISTRDPSASPRECSFEEAVLTGIADDGGLFVPRALPKLSADTLRSWAGLSFASLAFEVVSLFVDPEDVPRAELRAMLDRAFASFSAPGGQVVPVVTVGSVKIAELWHGPTLAFKDIGMQFVAQLLDFYLLRRQQRVSIVVSTSGDTGPAAIHATKGKAAIDSFVLFPRGLVSRRQALQMTTVPDRNVHVYEVMGATSDDLDVVVKNLNSDLPFKRQHALLSINSFNWARVLSQTIHFFFAYLRVCPRVDSPVVFSVPTGAMGDGMAAFVARRMGLPISRIVLATNENDVIAKFFETGVYLKPPSLKPTISPAIDIQVPYNLERLLYFCSDSAQSVLAWMTEFERTGRVEVPSPTMAVAREAIVAVMVDQRETFDAIRRSWSLEGYVLDPHTAVGVSGAEKVCAVRAFGPSKSFNPLPVICLATAHCSKFEAVTKEATGADRDVPDSIRRIEAPSAGYHARLVDVTDRATGKLDGKLFAAFEASLKADIARSFGGLKSKL